MISRTLQSLALALLIIYSLALPLPAASPVASTPPPPPDHLQYFGYWGDSAAYMDELLGYANFISFSADADNPAEIGKAMVKAKEHGMKVVLGIGNCFLGDKMRLRENYQERWEKCAKEIEPHIGDVAGFFLVDEPITWIIGQKLPWEPVRRDLDTAAALMKKTFPGTPVMVDFAGDLFEPAEGATTPADKTQPPSKYKYAMLENADWIGLECYDVTADFYKIIALLKSRLNDKQKIVIIPNATSFGHHSTPELLKLADHLYEVAKKEERVVALMTFMWQGSWDPTDSLRGARDVPELREKYLGLGKPFVTRDRKRNAGAPYWLIFTPEGTVLFQGTQEELLKERAGLTEKLKSPVSYSKIEPADL